MLGLEVRGRMSGCQVLDVWMSGARSRSQWLDVRCYVLDIECWLLDVSDCVRAVCHYLCLCSCVGANAVNFLSVRQDTLFLQIPKYGTSL